jgi:O-antigen/teichoic acid export membrane protein/glycosyltransferase involved in cell wall biosynthesis
LKPFDINGEFQLAAPDGGDKLRRVAVRGAGVTLLSGGTGLAIQVVATVVLARLLTPKDFGLVTMVTTFSLLLVNFGLNGLTEAVVQCEEISHKLASALFWVNLAGGFLLMLGFAAAGSLLAKFYHDARVQQVAIGISPTILITSASVLHLALLKRAMRFPDLSFNDIRARLISVGVSILLGWMGWGYWALVVGAVALPLSVGVGAWWMCRWIPGRPRQVAGTRPLLRFALHTYGNFSVNYFSRNTDNLLVGWRFDAQSLGFYKKAYDLFALSASQFVSSIAIVVVAALSRVRRDQDQYRRYLLGAMTVMAFAGMGVAADLTLIGRDLIRLLLGPAWDPAGRIFTYFAPGIGMMILYYTHGWIHLSIGRADRWFRWGIFEFAVTCSLFVVGLHWGPVGIALAWTVSFWVLTIPALWYAGRPINLGVGPMLSVIWRYLLASAVAGVVTALTVGSIPALIAVEGVPGAVLRIVAVSITLGVFYIGMVVLLHGGFEPLRRVARLVREMLPGKHGARTAAEGDLQGGDSSTWAPQNSEGLAGSHLEPLVSILIPAHNAEEWIADTIRSAMAQTWARKEIIVVDDGSSDRTLETARQFEGPSVRVVWQANQGASAARNKAFSLSQGDYIQWLDADDLLAPDKIALQVETLRQGVGRQTLLSSSWGQFMYRPNRARFIPTALWADLSPAEWLLRKLKLNVFMQTATWLVSRELSEAAGPWDTRLLSDDDGEYFCRVLMASDGVRFVPESKVYYRAFGFNSLSYVGRSTRKIEAHWLSMQLHIGYLRSLEDSPRVHEGCLQYLRTSLIYFYPEVPDIVRSAQQMARELGEELGVPSLSWKYSWVARVFGWRFIKPLQRTLRRARWTVQKQWDRALFRIQSGGKSEPMLEYENGSWQIFEAATLRSRRSESL